MPPRVTAIATSLPATGEGMRRGWEAGFDLLAGVMAFAHVGLVVKEPNDVDQRAELRRLQEAAYASVPRTLPASDRPWPLGTHIELDDVVVRRALRRAGPHLLNVVIYAESDRELLRTLGAGAATSMLEVDDFGEVLMIDMSALPGVWTSAGVQAWLDQIVTG